MELTTGVLDQEQFQAELVTVTDLLKSRGVTQAAVSYGFGCDVDVDAQYVDVAVAADGLKAFVEQSVREGKYRFGSGDLYVRAEGQDIEFLFCNDGDIHLYTEDAEVFERVRSEWVRKGYSGHEELGGEWRPLT